MYAVHKGRKVGVFDSWAEASQSIIGFSGAVYKKFKTREEAENFAKYGRTQNKMTDFIKVKKPQKKQFVSISDMVKTKKSVFVKDVKEVKTQFLKNQEPIEKQLLVKKEPVQKNQLLENTSKSPAMSKREQIHVYCDGAVPGNGSKYAPGGIGIWFGEGHPENVAEAYTINKPTNNRTEIYALTRTLQILARMSRQNPHKKYNFSIYTDSQYTIDCLTKWMPNWKKNGWMNRKGQPVKNQKLLMNLYTAYMTGNYNIYHVSGHTGLKDGNYYADMLANEGARKHPNWRTTKKY